MSRPDLVVYHSPCLDGTTAAWTIWKKWKDVDFMPGVYQSDPAAFAVTKECFRGKNVLILDFSYKAPQMRELAFVAASITVLDHHESAERELLPLFEEGVIGGEFDMKRSGAMMAWNYAFPHDVPPRLTQYVQDRDLWTWELPDSQAINAYIQLHAQTFDTWNALALELMTPSGYKRACDVGGPLVDKAERELTVGIAETTRRMRIAGYDVPVANLPYFMASEAGNRLCKGEPFAAIYFDATDGRRQFSLRSDKDSPNAVNVSLIASQFGGGGHKNAAGFTAPNGWEGA